MTLIELYMPVFGEAAPRKGEDRENCSDELNQDTTPLLPNTEVNAPHMDARFWRQHTAVALNA